MTLTLREGAWWLPSVLLLLQVPGCVSLSGPDSVVGIVGRSLSVQCCYKEKYRGHLKYWCISPCLTEQAVIVKTRASEREVRSGRVSIRDHPAALTFTVTWEDLTEEDAGTYCCGISVAFLVTDFKSGIDPKKWVTVSVFPAPMTESFPITTMTILSPPTTSPPSTWPSTTRQDTPGPSQYPRSPLFSVHFLFLVFVKLPLFLSMLGAVLWVNWPLRVPAWKWGCQCKK
ncbi:CMRF35-like molecule 6 [Erinaceus europaeus]|uniref:CMRF35-like molecule 6 n=1 Tax=Erinaceus europaeus TaxID=9365 RepID=A0ABM3YBF3_ERIEU|nr:CMRF35-like molecule 6 [Erinaceus europaeus]